MFSPVNLICKREMSENQLKIDTGMKPTLPGESLGMSLLKPIIRDHENTTQHLMCSKELVYRLPNSQKMIWRMKTILSLGLGLIVVLSKV